MNNVWGVILAGGKSKRTKTKKNKLFLDLLGNPLIFYPWKSLSEVVGEGKVIFVYGENTREICSLFQNSLHVLQDKPLGTGDALKKVHKILKDEKGYIIVIPGDVPLLTPDTLKKIYLYTLEKQSDITVLTANLDNPRFYGRIIKNSKGEIEKIVEYKDASEKEREIKEVNAGVYVFKIPDIFELLYEIKSENAQREYYLTDVIEIANKRGKKVISYRLENWKEMLGANTLEEFNIVFRIMKERIITKWLNSGVIIYSPDTVYIDYGVNISPNVFIYPYVVLKGKTTIGENCVINSFSYVEDAHIPSNTVIPPFSFIKSEKSFLIKGGIFK
ncbi:GcaD protein [Candidatus Pacearchaeota archaeon]|nr:MAG: GcaD protein [Candidatus Pacearchaeota archaeon]